MVIGHACPRSPPGSPDNLSLQSRTGIGLVILALIIIAPLLMLAASSPAQNVCDGKLRSYGRCEKGTMSCVFSPGVGGNACIAQLNFSPAFTNTPSVSVIEQDTSVCPDGNDVPCSNSFAGTGVVNDENTTWIGMPTSATELFNSVNYRLNFSSNFASAVIFHFYVTSASISANALLRLQYSTNAGVSWFNVCSKIFGTGTGWFVCGSPTVLFIGSLLHGMLFRVLGLGGGAADNPKLGMIYTEFLDILYGESENLFFISTTLLQVEVYLPGFASVSQTTVLAWKAVSETG